MPERYDPLPLEVSESSIRIGFEVGDRIRDQTMRRCRELLASLVRDGDRGYARGL
jgi:hypothetical protein